MKQHLIIFTRYPEPHRTKTRMILRLRPEGAAEPRQATINRRLTAVARVRTRS